VCDHVILGTRDSVYDHVMNLHHVITLYFFYTCFDLLLHVIFRFLGARDSSRTT